VCRVRTLADVPAVRSVPSAALTAAQLHALLSLRCAVFIVEQGSPFQDPDPRDLEAGTSHLWLEDEDEDGAGPLAYLRMCREPDGSIRIGRVCTALRARGRGLARLLLEHALAAAAGGRVVLSAQPYLRGWYAGYGFEAVGAEYVEDGIAHIDMVRPAATGQGLAANRP
jgi:ElaA protein